MGVEAAQLEGVPATESQQNRLVGAFAAVFVVAVKKQAVVMADDEDRRGHLEEEGHPSTSEGKVHLLAPSPMETHLKTSCLADLGEHEKQAAP